MQQHKKDQHDDVFPATGMKPDSPTIQHLIEQLDRDLEETQRKASKAQ